MNYEKKYKKALEKFRKDLGKHELVGVNRAYLEDIFPELAESEDEKIRKELITIISCAADDSSHIYMSKVDSKRYIAWLEKQGEQKPVDTSEIEMKRHNEGYIKGVRDAYDNVNQARSILNQLRKERPKQEQKPFINMITPEESLGIDSETYGKIVDECIYGEQPADKVEPKFKLGDWITNGIDTKKIIGIDLKNEDYLFENGISDISLADSISHLWTIQDAHDCDVLCDYSEAYDNPLIFILKKFECVNFGLVRPSDYSSYCFLTAGDIQRFKEGTYHHKHNIHPATKEQRDLLFQKMKKAGYEWDAEKKELKKIIDEKQIKKSVK